MTTYANIADTTINRDQRCDKNFDLLTNQYIDQFIELSPIPCLTCKLSDLMSEYHPDKVQEKARWRFFTEISFGNVTCVQCKMIAKSYQSV